MAPPPDSLEKVNRKLNTLLVLVGLMFFYILSSYVFRLSSIASPGGTRPALTAWDAGRPFGADLDGSQEQRNVVDRAKGANGHDAAKIHLHVLNLSGITLNEDELATVGTMIELRDLSLCKTNFQDKDVVQLANLEKMEVLNLSETGVTDDCLPVLRRLRHLRSLDLTGTRVSARGVRALHDQMPTLRAKLYGSESRHFGGGIHATVGKFLLLKYGPDRIAFKFTAETKTGEGGAEYVWYWQPVAGGKFQGATLKSGKAEVFEKYRRTKQVDAQTTLIENDGGVIEMNMGPAKLMWSKPRSVYYPSDFGSAPSVVFAFSSWEQMEDIHFEDETLKWYEKTGR